MIIATTGVTYTFADTTSGNFTYRVIDGTAYITGYSAPSYNDSITNLTIPENIDGFVVAGINNFAFNDSSVLTTLTLADTVEYVGLSAFQDITTLTSVNLGKSLEAIDENAFSGCTKLSSIELPSTILSIGENAFNGDTLIKELKIPENTVYIGARAFYNTSITSVILPKSLYRIGESAFSSLNTAYIVNNSIIIDNDGLGHPKTIYCNPDSTAENYAKSNSVTYNYICGQLTGLKQTSSTFNSLSFSWNEYGGAIGYKIYLYIYDDSTKTYKYVKDCITTNTNYKFSNLKSNTAYRVRGKAYKNFLNENCYGPFSEIITTATQLNVDGEKKVTGMKYSKLTNTSVTLTWNKLSGTGEYRIYMYNEKTKKYDYKTKTTSNAKTIKGLKPGVKYRFVVRKVFNPNTSDINFSQYSNKYYVATKPNETKNVKITGGKKKIVYDWATRSSATGYQVAYKLKGKSYKSITVSGCKNSKKTIKNLKPGTYYIKVRCYKTYTKSDGTKKNVYTSYTDAKKVVVKK